MKGILLGSGLGEHAEVSDSSLSETGTYVEVEGHSCKSDACKSFKGCTVALFPFHSHRPVFNCRC